LIFPCTGQIWEAQRECEVGFTAAFNPGSKFKFQYIPAPSTPIPVGSARLSRGEKVRVVFADEPKPLTIWFQPLRYDDLHEIIVPVHVRAMPGYSHYTLSLRSVHTACCLDIQSDYFVEAFKQFTADQ
jgi:hypothetical protein